jgi:hypothetical protein
MLGRGRGLREAVHAQGHAQTKAIDSELVFDYADYPLPGCAIDSDGGQAMIPRSNVHGSEDYPMPRYTLV